MKKSGWAVKVKSGDKWNTVALTATRQTAVNRAFKEYDKGQSVRVVSPLGVRYTARKTGLALYSGK